MTSVPAPLARSLGCVLRVETGIYEVWTSQGQERATMGGDLLASVAGSDEARPNAGDWVDLVRWCDGRLTMSGKAGRPRRHLRLVS